MKRFPLFQNASVGLSINSSGVRYIVDLYGDSVTLLDESEREKRSSAFERIPPSPELQDTSSGTRPLVFADHMMDVCNNPSTRSQTHTSRWIGVAGQLVDGYVPSSAEISSILNESTEGFFVYTPESLLSQIPPNVITSLSFLSK